MALIPVLVLPLLVAAVHRYLWIRLVRDVSSPGGWYRRVGTVLAFVLPVLAAVSMAGNAAGLPFRVLQVVSPPGFYWLAAVLYLVLALLVGEIVRFLWLRQLRRRDGAAVPAERAGEAEDAGNDGGAEEDAVLAPAAAAAARTADTAPHQAAGAGGTPRRTPGEDGAGNSGDGPGGEERDSAPAAGASQLRRRQFVSRVIGSGAALIAGTTVGYGAYNARQLRTKRVSVTLANLPRAAHGYRIAVVSDIHLSAVLGRSHCQRVVDAVNATQPDLVTVVGDLVDAEVGDLRAAAEPLTQLRARDGQFFVTGNHEYYVDTEEWIAHVRELGLTPLENERRELPYFDLAGVNDLRGEDTSHGGPDFEAALGDRDPRRTSVLMAHQPVQIHEAVDYGVDLQLSGHTHGGQLWPATYVAGLANPTLAGLERYGDTQLYVSRGAGAWGPPPRVGAPSDITVIELASRQA